MSYSLLPSFQTTSTSSNSSTNPYAPAIPLLNTGATGAIDAYNNSNSLPTIAAMDPNVTAGQNALLGIAGQGATSNAAAAGINGLQGILGNGGIGAPMQYGMDMLKQNASYLTPYANGSMLQNNPMLDAIIAKTNADTMDSLNASYGKAGRYGSAAWGGNAARQLGANENNLRYTDYGNQVQNQFNAINGLNGIGTGVAGIGQQGINNVMNGGNALASYYNPLTADANTQSSVGGQRMDYAQSVIDANRNTPWQNVQNLIGAGQGIGSMGGTSSSNSTSSSFGQQPVQNTNPSTGQMIAGGLLGGIGSLANFGKAGGFKSLFSLA
jgi:hypothetical protein